MGAIVDGWDLIGLLSNGKLGKDSLTNLVTDGGAVAAEMIYAHKDSRAQGAVMPGTTGLLHAISLFQTDGTPLPGAATPTTWTNPTRATAGGLMQANPGGGRTKFLTSLCANCLNCGTLVLYDRLAHMGGLDGTLLTAQNVNGGSLGGITRNTGGVNNQIWAEIYTAIGGTVTTLTASYQDGAGATQTSQPIKFGGTGRNNAQTMYPLSLTPGGYTVKGVTSVTLAASTGTVGNFGITILRPLAWVTISAASNSAFTFDAFTGSVPVIDTDASLVMMWIPGISSTSSIGPWDVFATFVEI